MESSPFIPTPKAPRKESTPMSAYGFRRFISMLVGRKKLLLFTAISEEDWMDVLRFNIREIRPA
jgi:hypothetical protein